MLQWPYNTISLSPSEIQRAVQDEAWQKFRRSLKGHPTAVKLDKLYNWWADHPTRDGEVQVTNYLNALKRGGQLDMNLRVVR